MKISTILGLAISTAVLVGFSPFANAHEGATGIVKERMDAMSAMGKATKAISERLRANRNLPAIKGDAAAIQAAAGQIPAWFPPGSNASPTDAKPEIWTAWDDFVAKAKRLDHESATLSTLAEAGDPTRIAAQFRVMGNICSDCHRLYRVKREP